VFSGHGIPVLATKSWQLPCHAPAHKHLAKPAFRPFEPFSTASQIQISARRIRRRSVSSFFRVSSCSQMRRTVHLCWRKARATRRSRALLRANLDDQYATRERGVWPWREQPCQKQPSTNTATRSRRQTKSGEPRRRDSRRHPVIRAARSNRTSRCSVLALPVLRTRLIIAERRLFVKTSAISVASFVYQWPVESSKSRPFILIVLM
jgi:hypothetical protein